MSLKKASFRKKKNCGKGGVSNKQEASPKKEVEESKDRMKKESQDDLLIPIKC
eukprot:CAMPEP_0202960932 /NCGR_PEP_ID=MMETSP1396-20130829/5062_1 /ASSEMBLY_ACC=CAM_ASM_000872 /TAXON_ID= /ORGANISM="Pseudokeronopsis sp., Strain Brazil" /LENGTH=52 /DNA_ID=CAMNT_0049680463 /DNA_START=917 /DNA_END=1075 /DNA_ORIENTATION=-